ncbi:nitric oxide synthase oxygenase [Streptomyces sp. NPDC047028]|uniref:nitric oxide synthase oxygenase n=1 Tax=Streptomyces sp. NPDC047028 TaxID=3155793 RepID=UPI0033C19919
MIRKAEPITTIRTPGRLGRLRLGYPGSRRFKAASQEALLWAEAEQFIRLHHSEDADAGSVERRLASVRRSIERCGRYQHTTRELEFGARVAWRNSVRCIGRLYWHSLVVRDLRRLSTARQIADACIEHITIAANGGRIRPVISVFGAGGAEGPGPRIWNEQIIRYAGYRLPGDGILGDPRNTALTETALALGWPGGKQTPHDILPLIVQERGGLPQWFEVPADAVLEVDICHPEGLWGKEWGVRWHAVPAISGMLLRIGGISYPAAPFNGWYMGTEIGARNLADEDRYNLLPRVAERLGLNTSSDRTLWKDRALVELNRAVLDSFANSGVTITDHHTEAARFMLHIQAEARNGRTVHADWSWIVPPLSGAATPVFHRTYENIQCLPAFLPHPSPVFATDTRTCPAEDGAGQD